MVVSKKLLSIQVHPGPGGRYDDICDVTGKIYLELDFSTPVVGCPNCSIDGYTGTTIASGDTFELIQSL